MNKSFKQREVRVAQKSEKPGSHLLLWLLKRLNYRYEYVVTTGVLDDENKFAALDGVFRQNCIDIDKVIQLFRRGVIALDKKKLSVYQMVLNSIKNDNMILLAYRDSIANQKTEESLKEQQHDINKIFNHIQVTIDSQADQQAKRKRASNHQDSHQPQAKKRKCSAPVFFSVYNNEKSHSDTKPEKVIFLDFDLTIAYSSLDTVFDSIFRSLDRKYVISSDKAYQTCLDKFCYIPNQATLQDFFNTILASSKIEIVIATYSLYPKFIPYVLKKIGLTDEQLGKITIVSGRPKGYGAKGYMPVGKNHHMRTYFQYRGWENEPPLHVLVDDSLSNIIAAIKSGVYVFYVLPDKKNDVIVAGKIKTVTAPNVQAHNNIFVNLKNGMPELKKNQPSSEVLNSLSAEELYENYFLNKTVLTGKTKKIIIEVLDKQEKTSLKNSATTTAQSGYQNTDVENVAENKVDDIKETLKAVLKDICHYHNTIKYQCDTGRIIVCTPAGKGTLYQNKLVACVRNSLKVEVEENKDGFSINVKSLNQCDLIKQVLSIDGNIGQFQNNNVNFFPPLLSTEDAISTLPKDNLSEEKKMNAGQTTLIIK